jgi:molecular chaperone GrpE
MNNTEKPTEDSKTPDHNQSNTDSPEQRDSQETQADTNGPPAENEATDSKKSPEEALQQEVVEYRDRFLRAHADMENMRRRMDKERTDLLKYGMEGFFKDFLPILDSFSKIDLSGGDEASFTQFAEGVGMVKKQLLDLVVKHGLEAIKSEGEPFDPNLHQAIQKIESEDVENEVVADEFATGYLLNGRLIRPSMVSVKVPTSSGK